MNTPGSVSELYPSKWLKPADLNGRSVPVTIQAVQVEEFRIPNGENKVAAVLTFVGKQKRLILNKTMCHSLATMTGSEQFADWIGHMVTLAPDRAPSGKPTIAIRRAPQATAAATHQEGQP